MEDERSIQLPLERGRGNKILRKCLIASSIILWMEGAFFFLIGVFAHTFLKRLFADWQGLRYAAEFPVVSILFGIVIVSIAFWINYIIIFPTRKRYYFVCGVLVLIFLFVLIYFTVRVDYSKRVENLIFKGFLHGILNYRDGFASNLEINLIQSSLKCCGAKNYKDWFETTWASGRMEVPASCCIDVMQCHNLEPVMVDDIYLEGCEQNLRSSTKMFGRYLPLIFVVLSIINLVFSVAFTLSLGIKEETRVRPRRRRLTAPEVHLIRSSSI